MPSGAWLGLAGAGNLMVLFAPLALGLVRLRGGGVALVGKELPSADAASAPQPLRGADDHEHDARLERERRGAAERIREEQIHRDEEGEKSDEGEAEAHENHL